MNFDTKTVTTKIHTGTFSADEIKAVSLSYATKLAGIDAASLASSKVDIAADGSVTVELVETIGAAAQPATQPAEKPAIEPSATAPVTPSAPAAPAFHFAKAS